MTLWAVGDVQGCADAFEALLAALDFDASDDELWLVGDLVNRGPDSLRVLRRVMALGDRVTAVLGNHELHLLANVAGLREPAGGDSFGDVLAARDRGTLVDWLRRRPLLHYDKPNRRVLVHAGIPPTWKLSAAIERAAEAGAALAGRRWERTLKQLYARTSPSRVHKCAEVARLRETVTGLTRMRYCDRRGRLDLEQSGPPGTQPEGLMPWFDWPGRPAAKAHIVFGHWASLGLLRRADVTAVDTGCVWGGRLTAVPVDTPGDPVSVACAPAASKTAP